MHDLNTIIRLNEEAHGQAITSLRDQGKHVVAMYDGVHLVKHDAFDSADAALIYVERQRSERVPGRSFHLYPASQVISNE